MNLTKSAYWKTAATSIWKEIWEAKSYYDRFAALSEEATNSIVLVGWQLDGRFPFENPKRETLREKLFRLCEEKPNLHIYLLLWDHAYFYVVERETMQARRWESLHPRVHLVFDNRLAFGACHHEKMIIFDGTRALCGGIDICDDRWDTIHHYYRDPHRKLTPKDKDHGPYHELAVEVAGPICADLLQHIQQRWNALSSIDFPEAQQSNDESAFPVHISRTYLNISPAQDEQPVITENYFLFKELIEQSKERLILEGQYYWSEKVNHMLLTRMLNKELPKLAIEIYLSDPDMLGGFNRCVEGHQLRLLSELKKTALSTGTQLKIFYPYALDPEGKSAPKAVYVHSKLLVVDDEAISIGSANYASRSLFIDTELQLTKISINAQDKIHLKKFLDTHSSHWKEVLLVEVDPDTAYRSATAIEKFIWSFSWHKVVDPDRPYFFYLRRSLEKTFQRRAFVFALSLLLFLFFSHYLTLGILNFCNNHLVAFNSFDMHDKEFLLLSFIFSSCWLIPIPLTLFGLLLAMAFNANDTILWLTSALWSASLTGYSLTRIFPNLLGRYFRSMSSKWLPKQFGLRKLPVFISVVIDPRFSIQNKISFQGLSYVPLPWFLISMLGLLPTLLWTAVFFSKFILAHTAKDISAPFILNLIWATISLALILWIRKLFSFRHRIERGTS